MRRYRAVRAVITVRVMRHASVNAAQHSGTYTARATCSAGAITSLCNINKLVFTMQTVLWEVKKGKGKAVRYRPGVAQRVPGS